MHVFVARLPAATLGHCEPGKNIIKLIGDGDGDGYGEGEVWLVALSKL